MRKLNYNEKLQLGTLALKRLRAINASKAEWLESYPHFDSRHRRCTGSDYMLHGMTQAFDSLGIAWDLEQGADGFYRGVTIDGMAMMLDESKDIPPAGQVTFTFAGV